MATKRTSGNNMNIPKYIANLSNKDALLALNMSNSVIPKEYKEMIIASHFPMGYVDKLCSNNSKKKKRKTTMNNEINNMTTQMGLLRL